MKNTFKITGMTCAHCVAKVEKGIQELAGVDKVKVHLKKGTATVTYQEEQLVKKLLK
ncbi:copper chaperone CopZ [Carnobacterium maltaromaticum LMA28]|uniref:Copper chaperone CopZ n=1 Tax=Carnobacterium maltaromaticum LMA28 TaxID=1234679 RepID=K8E6W3_CARML|nr:cation transporter [Carnobacterium maltaromaticum]CCO12574.2 copper chaperone CopZ [Carnobacterium maltaromaticum LMA28]